MVFVWRGTLCCGMGRVPTAHVCTRLPPWHRPAPHMVIDGSGDGGRGAHWAPRTRKRQQQEQRPQRPTERSDPPQHAKGRTGDCPGPRKETATRRNVTRGGAHCPGEVIRKRCKPLCSPDTIVAQARAGPVRSDGAAEVTWSGSRWGRGKRRTGPPQGHGGYAQGVGRVKCRGNAKATAGTPGEGGPLRPFPRPPPRLIRLQGQGPPQKHRRTSETAQTRDFTHEFGKSGSPPILLAMGTNKVRPFEPVFQTPP